MARDEDINKAAQMPLKNDEQIVAQLANALWVIADSQNPPVHPSELPFDIIKTGLLRQRGSGLISLQAIGRRFERNPSETYEQVAIREALAKIAIDQATES